MSSHYIHDKGSSIIQCDKIYSKLEDANISGINSRSVITFLNFINLINFEKFFHISNCLAERAFKIVNHFQLRCLMKKTQLAVCCCLKFITKIIELMVMESKQSEEIMIHDFIEEKWEKFQVAV
jgi:hypothetical protein